MPPWQMTLLDTSIMKKKAPRSKEEIEKLIEKSFLTGSGREAAREVLLGG